MEKNEGKGKGEGEGEGEDGRAGSSLPISPREEARRSGHGSRRRGKRRFLGCGKSGMATAASAEPDSDEQLRLWLALQANSAEFLVSHQNSKLPAGHRATSLVLHRRMFEHTNSDGVKGFVEGLRVAPLAPACRVKPQTLHVEEQLMSALPHEDAAWSFARCAVVGNSGRLLHSARGAEIDAHDAVFRINYAPLEGYERYVGSRTTFDVINAVHSRRLVHQLRNQTQEHGSAPAAQEAARRESVLVVFEVLNKWVPLTPPRARNALPAPWWSARSVVDACA